MAPTDRYIGCLLGSALGDSLLLPAECLPRTIVAKRFPPPLRQRLFLGRGMVSDDTEHAFLTAQALLAAGDDPQGFARALACRLRWWLVAFPGGCGMATIKGLLRSWIGIPPSRSGVFSAGNGPAMRSAIIGLRWARDAERLRSFVHASTILTHSDPRAETAALAVALAAAHSACGNDQASLWTAWRSITADPVWQGILDVLESHHTRRADVDEVAAALGCPEYVSGYSFHSVPVALYAWLRHRDDPRACLGALLRCGGDTDTMGAIAGALLGTDTATVFPDEWIDQLAEWPLSRQRLIAAGHALAEGDRRPVLWWWPLQPVRNIVFIGVLLLHVLRRLLP